METLVVKHTCDNPNCGNIQIIKMNDKPRGYVIKDGTRTLSDRTINIPHTFACSLDCIAPGINYMVSTTSMHLKPEPDPLDESNHDPRVVGCRRLTRRNCGKWHMDFFSEGPECSMANTGSRCTGSALADWVRDKSVRFATDVN